MKSKNITHFVTHNEKQANYVERFIKTIKNKIFKYMVEKNSPRYIEVLPKIVHSYNRTWHSGIRSEPINVNKTNEKQLWWQMYWPKEPYDPKKKKHEVKYRLKLVIEFEQLFFVDLFNVNMTRDGQEKFLKFLEDL